MATNHSPVDHQFFIIITNNNKHKYTTTMFACYKTSSSHLPHLLLLMLSILPLDSSSSQAPRLPSLGFDLEVVNNNSKLGNILGKANEPGGLPITLLIIAIVVLLVLIAIGMMLIYLRLCFGTPASAAPGMLGGPKGACYLKGGLKGGPKGGGFKGGGGGSYSDPKAAEASAQGNFKSCSTKKGQQGMMEGGGGISYERQTLKSKQSKQSKQAYGGGGKGGFFKSKQAGGKNRKQFAGKRSSSNTSKNSTSSGQTNNKQQQQRHYKKGAKSRSKGKQTHGKHSDQTMLYKQSVQYYKQFLKSVHSVKSVSEYFGQK